MSNNKANYFKIGLFVIFACILLVGIVVALGVGKWTKESFYIETYIDESVQGLNVGSPVKHRGVQIGRVEKIVFAANEYGIAMDTPEYVTYNRYVMVVIAADPAGFAVKDEVEAKKMIKRMVSEGLRIRLTQQALTGVAYLETDYFDPQRYPEPKIAWYPKYIYIPSVQSVFSTFTQTAEVALERIAKVDFEKLSNNLDALLVNLNKTVDDAKVEKLSNEAFALMSELRESNATIKEFVASADQTNQKIQDVFTPVDPDFTPSSVPEVIARMDGAIKKIDLLITTQQPEVEEIIDSVREMVDNLNELSEDLKKYPKQILFGNPPAKSEVVR